MTTRFIITTREITGICDLLSNDLGRGEEDHVSVLRDYSGRGMRGEGCFAVVVGSLAEYSAFIAAVTLWFEDNDDEPDWELIDFLSDVRSDSLGYDTVYYFPGFLVEAVNAPAERG